VGFALPHIPAVIPALPVAHHHQHVASAQTNGSVAASRSKSEAVSTGKTPSTTGGNHTHSNGSHKHSGGPEKEEELESNATLP
jgi:hypothetical protein